MTRPFDTPVRIAQAVGITATAFIAGSQAAMSILLVPSLLQAPAPLLARQWRTTWDRAKAFLPFTVIGCSALFGWLTSRVPPNSTAFKYYLTAAVLFPSTIPYTLLVIGPVNKKLVEKSDSFRTASPTDTSDEVGVSKEETVHALVDKWATLNLVRAILSGGAAFLAAWASLNPEEGIVPEGIWMSTGANRIS